MRRVSSFLRQPSPAQLWLIECLVPTVEKGLRDVGFPPGLIVLRPDAATRIEHVPAAALDIPHLMALDLPEEAAVEVIEAVRACIPHLWCPVLLLDAKSHAFAFVNFAPPVVP